MIEYKNQIRAKEREMKNSRKFQNDSTFGFQGHFFQPPSSMQRILEDFKSDLITLEEAVFQIRDISIEEKDTEETNFKYNAVQHRFDF